MPVCDLKILANFEMELADRVGAVRYELWFGRNTRFRLETTGLIVGVPNCFFQDWLQSTFGELVREVASRIIGSHAAVQFVIDATLFRAARREQQEARASVDARAPVDASPSADAPRPAAQSTSIPNRASSPSRQRRWRRLAEFAVGPCNRVAHAAALSLADSPGATGNPLVFCGPVGTGKTHLLEGTYVSLRKRWPTWKIGYTTAEAFTNRFLASWKQNKLIGFRRHFRELDALIVDDLQFLAGKKATEEEFLHTFDVLLGEGRQVILSCDAHPKLAAEFSHELTDRVLGGTIWSLSPPIEETRLAILRAKAGRVDLYVPEKVLEFLAKNLRGNVRELEGTLNILVHSARFRACPIDLGLASEVLAQFQRHSARVVLLADVDKAVVRALHVETGALQSRRKDWSISHPRMLAMYLARKHTAASFAEVGQFFGGRNHSTVVAAEKKIRLGLEREEELALGNARMSVREAVERIERELLR